MNAEQSITSTIENAIKEKVANLVDAEIKIKIGEFRLMMEEKRAEAIAGIMEAVRISYCNGDNFPTMQPVIKIEYQPKIIVKN